MNKQTQALRQGPTDVLAGESRKSLIRSARSAWMYYASAIVVLAGVLLLLSPEPYFAGLLGLGILFAGLAVAWNIIGGFGGQFSLANAVFFGIGAYAVALLQVNFGISPFIGIVVGIVISMAVAAALSWPLFRLRGPYFAIGTLALSLVVLALAEYLPWTGGSLGVLIPFADQLVKDREMWGYIFLLFLAICLAVSLIVARGRLGYYLIAVRDDHDAAAAAGASPLRVKTVAFVISALLTSVGGSLYVMYLGFLDPPSFLSPIAIGAYIPLLALIGGIGTIVGPVLGGLILPPVQTYLRGELTFLPSGASEAAIGLILVLAALYFREGIWGKLVKLQGRFVRRGR